MLYAGGIDRLGICTGSGIGALMPSATALSSISIADEQLSLKHAQLNENSMRMMNMRMKLMPVNEGKLKANIMQQIAIMMQQIEPVIGRQLQVNIL